MHQHSWFNVDTKEKYNLQSHSPYIFTFMNVYLPEYIFSFRRCINIHDSMSIPKKYIICSFIPFTYLLL